MRRPTAPTPAAARLRRYLFPLLALVVGLMLVDRLPWQSGFDGAALRSQLQSGRVDEALGQLARAGDGDLLAELSGVNWWPAQARQRHLERVAREAAALPAASATELLLPAGRLREAPRAAQLSAPSSEPLLLELHASELGLQAAQVEVEPGQTVVTLGAPVMVGTSYDVVLTTVDGGLLSVLHFEVLPSAIARDVGVVMASAQELGGSGPGGDLLAALVALHFGLRQEALTRFDNLIAAEPHSPLGVVARELSAVALARLDRPAEALARLGED